MGKYNYSKFNDPDWSDDWVYKENSTEEDDNVELEDFVGWPDVQNSSQDEYWGIHKVNGRLEIDVRRFEYACYRSTDKERYFPEELKK